MPDETSATSNVTGHVFSGVLPVSDNYCHSLSLLLGQLTQASVLVQRFLAAPLIVRQLLQTLVIASGRVQRIVIRVKFVTYSTSDTCTSVFIRGLCFLIFILCLQLLCSILPYAHPDLLQSDISAISIPLVFFQPSPIGLVLPSLVSSSSSSTTDTSCCMRRVLLRGGIISLFLLLIGSACQTTLALKQIAGPQQLLHLRLATLGGFRLREAVALCSLLERLTQTAIEPRNSDLLSTSSLTASQVWLRAIMGKARQALSHRSSSDSSYCHSAVSEDVFPVDPMQKLLADFSGGTSVTSTVFIYTADTNTSDHCSSDSVSANAALSEISNSLALWTTIGSAILISTKSIFILHCDHCHHSFLFFIYIYICIVQVVGVTPSS